MTGLTKYLQNNHQMKPTKLILILFLALAWHPTHAKHVDKQTAMTVGKNFIQSSEMFASLKSNLVLQLAYVEIAADSLPVEDSLALPYYYIFNVNDDKGFVIVSGDDHVIPILGYSLTGRYDSINVPPAAIEWLENYSNQIQYVIKNRIEETPEIREQWDSYLLNPSGLKSGAVWVVKPLLTTAWGQGYPWNIYCPLNNWGVTTKTGCVATAMGQIINYWRYPESVNGNGPSEEYLCENLNRYITPDYSKPNYPWNSMSDDDRARLLYHCGVSTEMNYGFLGSGVTGYLKPYRSFIDHFSYNNVQYIAKSDDDALWIQTLKNELDKCRPVYYTGETPGRDSGHAFVCDGYDNYNRFHFNWGWDGTSNEYVFSVGLLNPNGSDYSYNQTALIGIEPPENLKNPDMRIYATLTPSTNPIGCNRGFSILTKIANYSGFLFKGSYCTGVFDQSDKFVDYVEILDNKNLKGGTWDDVTFTTSGISKMLPGTYSVYLYYKPTGGAEWKSVSDNGALINKLQLTVIQSTALVTTTTISGITQTTAISGGNVTSDGGATIIVRGVCWSTSQNPTIANSKTSNGAGTGIFTSNLTGLANNTVYYVRAYATNSAGTSYGNQVNFTTGQNVVAPIVTTTSISGIAGNTANSGGNVTSDGGATVTARGVCWSTSQNPTDANSKTSNGAGTGIFTSNISGLVNSTMYYVRAYATNSVGTSYGDQMSFATGQNTFVPTVTTIGVTDITQTTAKGVGNVVSDGGAAIIARGVCWSTSQIPTIGNSNTNEGTSMGGFSSSISGLIINTTYFIRAYGTNSIGTGYGTQLEFKTVGGNDVEDELINYLVKIYPNPANDFINIDLSEFQWAIDRIEIVNQLGQVVYLSFPTEVMRVIQVSTTGLASGFYAVLVTSGDRRVKKTVIIN